LSSAGKSSRARAILEVGKQNNLQPEIVTRLETIVLRAEAGNDMQHPAPRNNPPELRIKLLAQLYESGLHRQMIDAAQQLLESFPKSALLHNMLGTAYLDLRQYDLDRAGYEAAIALAPDYILPHVNLGVTLSLMGQFSEAIAHYWNGLKIDPNDIKSIIYIGNALQSKGDYEAAVESYRNAIALAPDCAEAHNNLGNALENQGNLQAAVTSYTQALVCEPKNEQNQNNLTRARQQLGATCSSKNPTDKQ